MGNGKLFDQIWQRKLKENLYQMNYTQGENIRVDKALEVLESGERILDIGCGSGILLSQAKKSYKEVYGIDIAQDAVKASLENGIQAEVVDLNAEKLPYDDEYFDCVTLLSSMQYFIDPGTVLKECYRVLSPSGFLLLSVPNMRALWRVGKLLVLGTFPSVSLDSEGYDGGTLHYFTYRNLHDLLAENGFVVEWAHGIFCVPYFLNTFPDRGIIGKVKREFFSAETFIKAIKKESVGSYFR